jgi:hypothetical protein
MCYGIAKLVFASRNRIIFSWVLKVPNQTRVFFEGYLISAAYRPHDRFLTQRQQISVSEVGVTFDGVRISFFVSVRFSFGEGGISAHSTSLDSGNLGSQVNLWRAIDAVTKKSRRRKK